MILDLANIGSAPVTVVTPQGTATRTAYSVARAGDVNGDGFDDIIIGAPDADVPSPNRPDAGMSYVVFGQAGGLPATVNLATVATGVGGFVIHGEDTGDHSGYSVSSAGDFNGDGFADLLIGAYRGDGPSNTRPQAGDTYVVFGGAGNSGPIELANVAAGIGGLVIHGQQANHPSASTVSTAGDVNGDGYDDIIIAATNDISGQPLGSFSSYVVFGQAGSTNPVDLTAVAAGTGGFVIVGDEAGDWAGFRVSKAGDVNGDGFDDIFVGAPYADGPANGRTAAGAGYVVFGKASGFTSPVLLSSIAMNIGGFVIDGVETNDLTGWLLSSAGDVNGDGFDDVLIAAQVGDGPGNARDTAGNSYVVFGKANFAGPVDLAALGGGGFVIYGETAQDRAARVAAAGDVNGDGFDDLLIGAYFSDGPNETRSAAGDTYLIFGQASFGTSIDLTTIPTGTDGVVIYGQAAFEAAGRPVSGVGDVDGDGLDDIMIGVPSASSLSGRGHIVHGSFTTGSAADHVTQAGTAGNDPLTGTANTADDMVGGVGDDTLTGIGGIDVLRGGQGDDVLILGNPAQPFPGAMNSNFLQVDGGNGFDILRFNVHMPPADRITDEHFRQIANIEKIEFGNYRMNITLGPIAERAFDWLPSDQYKINIDYGSLTTVNAGAIVDGSALTQAMHVDLSVNHGVVNVFGGAGDDWLHGGAADDIITSGGGNDIIISGEGRGNDIYDGGTGIDTAKFTSTTLGIVVDLSLATNQAVGAEIGTDQISNVENVVGGSGDDRITGDGDDNRLDGGAGNDRLTGGGGRDTFVYADGGGRDIVFDFLPGIDRIDLTGVLGVDEFSDLNIGPTSAGGTRIAFTDGGDLTLLGVAPSGVHADDFIFGQPQTASAGDDHVYVSVGDTLVPTASGVLGPSVLLANDSGAGPLSILGLGTARNGTIAMGATGGIAFTPTTKAGATLAEFTYTLGDGKDTDQGAVHVSLVHTTSKKDSLTISTQAGEFSFIDGFAGNDALTGGAGRDDLRGGDGNDALSGQGGMDMLRGGAGNDQLDGGLGLDVMAGNVGNDIYFVDQTGDMVQEMMDEGVDLVNSTAPMFTLSANVERLTLLGAGNIAGMGNALANTVIGNSGNNTISGLDGNDRLEGGDGNDRLRGGNGADRLDGGMGDDDLDGGEDADTYIVTGSDTVFDSGVVGRDQVIASQNFTLAIGNGIETLLTQSSAAIDLTGNELANNITGNDAGNFLRGGDGNDRLYGRGGEDRIEGGRGADMLSGGGDADTFILRPGDSGITSTTADRIDDFQSGLDHIRLSFLDSVAGPGAQYAETAVNSAAFGTILKAAQAEMKDGLKDAVFVAGSTDGWLFWSSDTNGATIEGAVRLTGLNNLGAFAQSDLT